MSEETNKKEETVAQEEKQYTPQEIKKMREQMNNYYKEENKHLKLLSEYENLQADIEEARVRRYIAIYKMSQLQMPPEEEMEEEEDQVQPPVENKSTEKPAKGKRQLKTN
jgi:hypothetical protein